MSVSKRQKGKRKKPYKELSSALHVPVHQRSQVLPSKKEKARDARNKKVDLEDWT